MNKELEPDLKAIYEEIKRQEIAFPDVFLAQVIHETGWLKSKVFLEHNNLCGMTCHPNWGTLCDCSGNNRSDVDGEYCDYKSINESIADYKQWQERRFLARKKAGKSIPATNEEYLLFLTQVGYATDRRYTQGVRKHISVALQL